MSSQPARPVPRDLDVTGGVASICEARRFVDLDDEVVDRSKRVVLDTVGCILLGSTLPAGRAAQSYVDSFSAGAESTVIGTSRRAPAPFAALANGTAAHADELDGVHRVSAHPAAIAVGGCLPMAESVGASGEELINAICLAFDVGCGLVTSFGGGASLRRAPRHLHAAPMIALGVAAAGARMLRLDASTIRRALALASVNALVAEAFLDEPTHMAKSLAQGQSAFAGVTGVRLASHGFAANERIIDAPDGLADTWWNEDADLTTVLDNITGRAHVLDNGFKYYSAGYAVQAPISASLALLDEHDIHPDSISALRVGMTSNSAGKVDGNRISSISLQDMLSVAIVRGKLGYEEAHDPANTNDADVLALRQKIEIVRDPEKDARQPRSRSAWVEIEVHGGRVHRAPDQLPAGHWELGGMPWVDVHRKFGVLAAHAGVDTPRITHIARTVEALEDLNDVSALIEALTG
ncbi:MAG: MmgE/PrpD family protein [Chloroflexota bacterium]